MASKSCFLFLLWCGACATTVTQESALQPAVDTTAVESTKPTKDCSEIWLGQYAGVGKMKGPGSDTWSLEDLFVIWFQKDHDGGLTVRYRFEGGGVVKPRSSLSHEQQLERSRRKILHLEHVESCFTLSGEVPGRIPHRPLWKYSFDKSGDRIYGSLEVNPELFPGDRLDQSAVFEFRVEKAFGAPKW